MRKAILAVAALFTLALSDASATVSFSGTFEAFNTSAGSGNPAPITSLVLLIADTTGDGFQGFLSGSSTTVGSLLNSDDEIIYRDDMSAFFTPGVYSLATPGLTLDSTAASANAGTWSPGDNIAIVWFPTLTVATLSLTAGNSYGMLTAGTTGSDAFSTPGDPGSRIWQYYSTDASSGFFEAGNGTPTVANQTVVPEPTSLLLAGIASLGLMIRRRRA